MTTTATPIDPRDAELDAVIRATHLRVGETTATGLSILAAQLRDLRAEVCAALLAPAAPAEPQPESVAKAGVWREDGRWTCGCDEGMCSACQQETYAACQRCRYTRPPLASPAPTAAPPAFPTPPGFAGVRTKVYDAAMCIGDHTHMLSIALYRFPDGTASPYVEVSESGPHAGTRLVSLSDAVHALRNLGEAELFAVGNREPSLKAALETASREMADAPQWERTISARNRATAAARFDPPGPNCIDEMSSGVREYIGDAGPVPIAPAPDGVTAIVARMRAAAGPAVEAPHGSMRWSAHLAAACPANVLAVCEAYADALERIDGVRGAMRAIVTARDYYSGELDKAVAANRSLGEDAVAALKELTADRDALRAKLTAATISNDAKAQRIVELQAMVGDALVVTDDGAVAELTRDRDAAVAECARMRAAHDGEHRRAQDMTARACRYAAELDMLQGLEEFPQRFRTRVAGLLVHWIEEESDPRGEDAAAQSGVP